MPGWRDAGMAGCSAPSSPQQGWRQVPPSPGTSAALRDDVRAPSVLGTVYGCVGAWFRSREAPACAYCLAATLSRNAEHAAAPGQAWRGGRRGAKGWPAALCGEGGGHHRLQAQPAARRAILGRDPAARGSAGSSVLPLRGGRQQVAEAARERGTCLGGGFLGHQAPARCHPALGDASGCSDRVISGSGTPAGASTQIPSAGRDHPPGGLGPGASLPVAGKVGIIPA